MNYKHRRFPKLLPARESIEDALSMSQKLLYLRVS